MKQLITLLIILSTITFYGQNRKGIKQIFKKINSKEDLEKYNSQNTSQKIEVIEFNENDSEFPKNLMKVNKKKIKLIDVGDEKYYYKLVGTSLEKEFRASYIYLNGRELTLQEIDSIRPIIIEKFKSGVTFPKLVEEYNMDGNLTKGDLGWFKKGKLVPDFEKAVIEHKKDDIFTVNVESYKWYYVVLKTHFDKTIKKLTFIRAKIRS